MRRALGQLALRLGCFDAARAAYHGVFNRRYRAHLRERQSFFATFVRRNDLVFDIGQTKAITPGYFAS